jgi:hypothetical protein
MFERSKTSTEQLFERHRDTPFEQMFEQCISGPLSWVMARQVGAGTDKGAGHGG